MHPVYQNVGRAVCSSQCTKQIPLPGGAGFSDAGGPYSEKCGGATTSIALDGSLSSDPDVGDVLTFAWSTNCPGGTFDDATLESPTLTVNSVAPCPSR